MNFFHNFASICGGVVDMFSADLIVLVNPTVGAGGDFLVLASVY